MKSTSLTLALAASATLTSLAYAGQEPASSQAAATEADSFNFCEWLTSKPGTVYKNPENPYIQEIQFSGRFHYNAAYLDGKDNNGHDFHDGYTDGRRLRLGVKTTFAKYFTLYAMPNLLRDSRDNPSYSREERSHGLEFQDMDEFWVRFDVGAAFDITALDKLTLQYGLLKLQGSQEIRESSNNLLTPERSAIANYVYDGGARPTGLWLNGVKGKWNATLGIYTSDGREVDLDQGDSYSNRFNHKSWASWNDDLMYSAQVVYSATDDLRFGWEFIYNHADNERNIRAGGDDNLLPYQWASTFSTEYTFGQSGIIGEVFVGDNGQETNANREDEFYGVVITPYHWIVPSKLQAVVQYMYYASNDPEGVRTNSRYFRATHQDPAVSIASGRGDALHTCYAGINWLICGDNLKFQFGAEYTSLNTMGGEATGTTYLMAFRSSF